MSGVTRFFDSPSGRDVAVSSASPLPTASSGIASEGSGSTTALGAGETFTGEWEFNSLSDALVYCKTDASGTLYLDFSPDGVNIDSILPFRVNGGEAETHTVVKGPRYVRARFVNGDVPQTYMRLNLYYGTFRQLNLPLNLAISQDSDATTVRAITEEVAIAAGLFTGYEIVNKFGTNSDVDMGTVPEDIWEVGGAYTGFPATGEALRALSSSANDVVGGSGAEVLRVNAMTEDYEWVDITFNLNGTTPVAPNAPYATTSFIRAHTATVIQSANGANTGVNAGVLTVRHATTTANVFLSVVAGRNQSNAAVYTIPAGYTGYMRSLHCSIRGTGIANTPAAVDGYIWTRTFGRPFRSRRPFTVSSSYRLGDVIYGGLPFTEKSDLVLRITASSADNVSLNGGFDLILVKN